MDEGEIEQLNKVANDFTVFMFAGLIFYYISVIFTIGKKLPETQVVADQFLLHLCICMIFTAFRDILQLLDSSILNCVMQAFFAVFVYAQLLILVTFVIWWNKASSNSKKLYGREEISEAKKVICIAWIFTLIWNVPTIVIMGLSLKNRDKRIEPFCYRKDILNTFHLVNWSICILLLIFTLIIHFKTIITTRKKISLNFSNVLNHRKNIETVMIVVIGIYITVALSQFALTVYRILNHVYLVVFIDWHAIMKDPFQILAFFALVAYTVVNPILYLVISHKTNQMAEEEAFINAQNNI